MTRMEARIGRMPTARVAARQDALRTIIASAEPVTVRRAFYIALPAGLYPKNERGYEPRGCRRAGRGGRKGTGRTDRLRQTGRHVGESMTARYPCPTCAGPTELLDGAATWYVVCGVCRTQWTGGPLRRLDGPPLDIPGPTPLLTALLIAALADGGLYPPRSGWTA